MSMLAPGKESLFYFYFLLKCIYSGNFFYSKLYYSCTEKIITLFHLEIKFKQKKLTHQKV